MLRKAKLVQQPESTVCSEYAKAPFESSRWCASHYPKVFVSIEGHALTHMGQDLSLAYY